MNKSKEKIGVVEKVERWKFESGGRNERVEKKLEETFKNGYSEKFREDKMWRFRVESLKELEKYF